MGCIHCGSLIPEQPHEDWCRENIPLCRRVAAYANAMFAVGQSPAQVFGLLSEAERDSLKGMA